MIYNLRFAEYKIDKNIVLKFVFMKTRFTFWEHDSDTANTPITCEHLTLLYTKTQTSQSWKGSQIANCLANTNLADIKSFNSLLARKRHHKTEVISYRHAGS